MAPFFCFGLVPNLRRPKVWNFKGFRRTPVTNHSNLGGFAVEMASTFAISLHPLFSIGSRLDSRN
ncbi:hypothetical protein COLO4_37411 [Corchorus olitorius]|uniref:Uncharacterized protein n=1 Tax=Corchorus olitorius TaxID=93759 RepID=A0A1R3G1Z9_9ROSI|nr:hypothetical protein COLO4_37411 [Corchorus olitorius]